MRHSSLFAQIFLCGDVSQILFIWLYLLTSWICADGFIEILDDLFTSYLALSTDYLFHWNLL